MLTFVTWLWGDKYSGIYVERLHAGLRRHLRQPFRFLLLTERERELPTLDGIERHDITDPELTKIPGCFARLRMFDPEWQKNKGLDGSIISLDLDVVITGELDQVFNRSESLVVLQGANSVNPCPYNNSVYMFQAGAHAELWNDFSIEVVSNIKHHGFPDDQGWFWHKLPKAAAWRVGSASGIYAFGKPGWVTSERLPPDARMVAFPGWRDPGKFLHLKWVRQHWL